MRRLTAGGLVLLAMTWAGSAMALALGEMDVRSRLNQGFLAVVPVVSATDEELDSLTVQIADNAEFVRAGIDRNDYLSTLQLSVVKLPNGGSVVKIRSSEIAREPFVSLVLEARWSTGRLVREYTGLLDPQVADLNPSPRQAAPAAPAVPAAAAAPVGDAEPQPPAVRRRVARPAAAPVPTDGAAGSYGPVAANETLWSIATRLQARLGGTVDQVLLQLYLKNPAAFEGGSINGVMKGVTLATPSSADVQSLEPVAAQKRVAELRGQRPVAAEPRPVAPAPTPTVARPEAAKPAAPSAPQPAVTAAAEPPAAKEMTPGNAGATAAAPTAAAPAAVAATPSPAEAAGTTGTPDAPAPAPAPAAVPEAASLPPAPAKPVPPPPVPAAPALGSDLAGTLASPPVAGGAALALLGVLGLIAVRRRRARAAEAAAEFADIPEIRVSEKEPVDVLIQPKAADEFVMPSRPAPPAEPVASAKAEPAADLAAPAPSSPGTVEFEYSKAEELPSLATSADVTDPLADADFHLSYGLHEEAANILKSALAKEPTRLELKRKLADVYFAGRRGLEFQELAEQLRSQVDTAEWKHIVELGRQLMPNAAIFKPTQSSQPYGVLPDIDLNEFDLSGDGPKPVPAEAPRIDSPAPAPAPLALDINSFDLATTSESKPDRIEFNLEELDLATPADDGSPSFSIGDEFDTKLDLARAYADMGDAEAALNLLSEVVSGGNDKQKAEATMLHDRLKG